MYNNDSNNNGQFNDNHYNSFNGNQHNNSNEWFNSNNGNPCNYAHHIDPRFAQLRAVSDGQVPAPTLSSNIRFWSHEPHQPLIGTIVGFDRFEHQAYGKQETVIVECENGEVVSAILTPYLQKGMELQDGQIGDAILIEKQGKERSKYGKEFNKFLLVIQK